MASEHHQTEAARRRLATGLPTRLSDLAKLDRYEFALFLGLLGDALGAGPPGPDGVQVLTSDGTLEIHLVPTGDGMQADLHTPDGVFHGDDHLITITDLVAPEPQLEGVPSG